MTEAGLLQAFGRARGINRTSETPLSVDLLFDACLPITVNDVSNWKPPSLLIETAAAEGVILTSPRDMIKAWPGSQPSPLQAPASCSV